jgi:ubiquinone/menaquinone biosynthesis C-methylase UbiE
MRSDRNDPTYATIGHGYDLTRRADPYLVDRLQALLEPRARGRYLDVACGTGNYTVALAARFGHWMGIDHAPTMIREASRKPSSVAWHVADVDELPFASHGFDGATLALALHHFAAPRRAFREIARVLGRDAPLVLFTATAEQMRGYWLNHYFPAAMARAIAQMPTLADTREYIRQGGFHIDLLEPYHVTPDLQDLFLYSGKHRPEIYLDERVRRGSSMFASLAAADEIADGCARLADDIACGRFAAIQARYGESTHGDYLGDYLFVRARAN